MAKIGEKENYVKLTTMYNYANKYISEKCTPIFREENFYKLKAFLFMNISDQRDADVEIYSWGENLFNNHEEFRNLTIGCLGNMKRVYGNNTNCNFDEAYKTLTHNPNASIDADFKKLDSKYKIKLEEENMSM